MRMITLRESTMLQLMNVATDKEDWHIKVCLVAIYVVEKSSIDDDIQLQNRRIAKKWKEEALSSGLDVTPKMVDWCLDELRYKASLISPDAPAPPIFVYNGDVFKSDNAVSAELKKALQENVKIFESKIPEKSKDWHPGSDQKVWDLVHPSLFPLVYGRTRILSEGETTTLEDCIQRCGQGKVTVIPTTEETLELEGSGAAAADDAATDDDADDGDGDDDNENDGDSNGDSNGDGDGNDGDGNDDDGGSGNGDDGTDDGDGDGDGNNADDGDGNDADDGDGEDSEGTDGSPTNPFSAKFQWLPCEVDISGDQAK